MIKNLNHTFDLEKLRAYFQSVKSFGHEGQISLTYRDGKTPYKDGYGQQYSDTNIKLIEEKDFSNLIDAEKNPIYDIIQQVRAIASTDFNCSIGRIRFMTLPSKSCLSYHRDVDPLRFHIPIYTNLSCFFVVNDLVYRMPTEGSLYTLSTNQIHTPINANKNFERTHLVFSTY